MSDELRQQLAEEITAAFMDAVYPGDEHFRDWDIDTFLGYDWRDVTVEMMTRVRDEMHMFSPQGFCYFAPAFLLAAVLQLEESYGLAEMLIVLLSPTETLLPDSKLDTWMDAWREQFIACLSKAQKEVIRKYFVSFRELEPDSDWVFMEWERERLDFGIEYWTKVAKQAE